MADIKQKGRLALKHDTEANWNKAVNFVPMKGEPIVYDPDESVSYSRIKIGDGLTTIVNLPFASAQSDMEQSDPNAPDFVKNRTHYREWKTYEKFEHLSMPGEEIVNDAFYPIDKVYDLVIGETYTMTYEVLDPSDNTTIVESGTEEIVASDLYSMSGEVGYEDVVCLYSSELDTFVFINGIYINIEAGTYEKSETNSYVLSATLLTDSEYPVRVIFEGPGFATEGWEYVKLPKEYLPIQELDVYAYKPEYYEEHVRFEYPNRCHVSRFVYNDSMYAFSPEIEGGYYVVTEVNDPSVAANESYGSFWIEAKYSIAGIIHNLCTLEDSSSVLPAVGDLIAFDYFIGGDSANSQISNNPFGTLNYRIVDTNSFTYRFIPRPTDKTSCSIDIFTTITTPDQKVTDAEKKFANLYLLDGGSSNNLSTDNSRYGQNLVEKLTYDDLYQGGRTNYSTQQRDNFNYIEFYTNTQNVDATSWIANIHIDIDIVAKDRILVKETMYCGIGVSTATNIITTHPNPAVEHRAWSVVPWKGNKYAAELDFFDEFKYIFFSFEDTYIKDIKITWR